MRQRIIVEWKHLDQRVINTTIKVTSTCPLLWQWKAVISYMYSHCRTLYQKCIRQSTNLVPCAYKMALKWKWNVMNEMCVRSCWSVMIRWWCFWTEWSFVASFGEELLVCLLVRMTDDKFLEERSTLLPMLSHPASGHFFGHSTFHCHFTHWQQITHRDVTFSKAVCIVPHWLSVWRLWISAHGAM